MNIWHNLVDFYMILWAVWLVLLGTRHIIASVKFGSVSSVSSVPFWTQSLFIFLVFNQSHTTVLKVSKSIKSIQKSRTNKFSPLGLFPALSTCWRRTCVYTALALAQRACHTPRSVDLFVIWELNCVFWGPDQIHVEGGWVYASKISPTYPWKVPQTFHQQFMKECLSLWGFGEVWGIIPGYVGKIMECSRRCFTLISCKDLRVCNKPLLLRAFSTIFHIV